MSAIKKFFEKRKLDVKFKTAGQGHKLTEDTKASPNHHVIQQRPVTSARAGPSEAARVAAEAAVNRQAVAQNRPGSSFGTSQATIKAQVRREIEAEKQNITKAYQLAVNYAPVKEIELETGATLAVSGVFFRCPLVGDVVLPKKEMERCIKEFLYNNLSQEPEMTSALMIHTFNKDSEQVKICIDTLCVYLTNILQHPEEEKYQKIRVQNKAFQERVAKLDGTTEFLQAAGFECQSQPGLDGVPEDFLVLNKDSADLERLQNLKDVLHTAEPIVPELDRNMRVLKVTGGGVATAAHMEVPSEFYRVAPEEVKREQQARQQAVEQMGMLRTKDMRERERLRELRRYRYTLIRVRFPDGLVLQGTFNAQEKLSALLQFVKDNLATDWIPFSLTLQGGGKLLEGDESRSLAELNLAPAALLHFSFDPNILQDVTSQRKGLKIDCYLKLELLQYCEPLS